MFLFSEWSILYVTVSVFILIVVMVGLAWFCICCCKRYVICVSFCDGVYAKTAHNCPHFSPDLSTKSLNCVQTREELPVAIYV